MRADTTLKTLTFLIAVAGLVDADMRIHALWIAAVLLLTSFLADVSSRRPSAIVKQFTSTHPDELLEPSGFWLLIESIWGKQRNAYDRLLPRIKESIEDWSAKWARKQPMAAVRGFLNVDADALVAPGIGPEIAPQLAAADVERLQRKVDRLRGWRHVEVIDVFQTYSDKCIAQLEQCTGTVYTVQTPCEVEAQNKEGVFEDYARKTALQLIEHDNIRAYHRLIVVDPLRVDADVSKTKRFLDLLFETANAHEQATSLRPALDHIKLHLINKNNVGKFFYSNLDLHITCDSQYVIAFQCYRTAIKDGKVGGEYIDWLFGLSTHVDNGNTVSPVEKLKQAFRMARDNAQYEFDFSMCYEHNGPDCDTIAKLDVRQKKLQEDIEEQMRAIATAHA